MCLRLFRYPALALPLLAVAGAVLAAVPTFWTLEDQADFLAGEVEGLSIASTGAVSLSPATRNLYEATDPFFWSLVSDSRGNLYLGSGNDGKVYKVSPSGDATVAADTNELAVHALAIDQQGNLYAGTSPRGRVFKIQPDGTQEVFFDPEDRYIWALAVDGLGNVLVASGEKANIYRVSPSGKSEVLFASQETHLVCLATDSEGNIYTGSDSNGLVFKITRDGDATVMFDTPFEEVHDIVLDMRGNVYAAAVNGETTTPAPSPAVPIAPTSSSAPMVQTPIPVVSESVTVTAGRAPALGAPASTATNSGGLKGALYRISPNGAAERLWESGEDIPLALRLETDDRIMVGTGKSGRIFLVRQDKTSSLHLRVDADQVTCIHTSREGDVFFATSNPARLYRLAGGRRAEGVYQSPIKDTTTVSSLGKIRWEARTPAGTGLVIQTRTGNSAKPDNTWSAWSPGYTASEGDQITSPRGRFLQWRAIFKSSGDQATPELLQVTAVYLQQNLAPLVSATTIHPPGQIFQKPLITTGEVEILGSESLTDTQGSPPQTPGAATSTTTTPFLQLTAMSRKLYRKGYQTVTWTATDPNDDTLSYDIYYRAVGESLWRPLRKDVREAVIAWDTVAMPDGRYNLRVVASDAPSNPVQLALTGEKETRSFDVDNTPPVIVDIRASRLDGGSHQIRFQARDDSSAVNMVEYAVDSGKWNVVYPTDGICDSRLEELDFTVAGYNEGVHVLVAKVTDLLGNVATARIELR